MAALNLGGLKMLMTIQNSSSLLIQHRASHDPSQLPLVWIVVLSWNNYEDTAECLHSLHQLAYPRYQILLVDNGSTDDTPNRVRAVFPEVKVLENGVNLGVPTGYNVGFRYALQHKADYVLMLNNDTTVDASMLGALVAAGKSTDAGILVPVVFHYHYPAKVWSAGARYRWFPPAIVMETEIHDQRDGYRALDYAIACGLLISRRAFEQAGLFDETIRFMWEDHDFAKRVRDSGLAILQVPEAKMWHKISRTTRPGTAEFWKAHGESGAIFYRRHYRLSYLLITVHLGYFALREFIVKRRWFFIKSFLQGLREGVRRPLRPIPRVDFTEPY
jgi:GT2 family glycosyltransferase